MVVGFTLNTITLTLTINTFLLMPDFTDKTSFYIQLVFWLNYFIFICIAPKSCLLLTIWRFRYCYSTLFGITIF